MSNTKSGVRWDCMFIVDMMQILKHEEEELFESDSKSGGPFHNA